MGNFIFCLDILEFYDTQDINSRENWYILKLCAFSFHSFDNFRPPPPPRRRMGGFRGGGGNDLNRGVWSSLRCSVG